MLPRIPLEERLPATAAKQQKACEKIYERFNTDPKIYQSKGLLSFYAPPICTNQGLHGARKYQPRASVATAYHAHQYFAHLGDARQGRCPLIHLNSRPTQAVPPARLPTSVPSAPPAGGTRPLRKQTTPRWSTTIYYPRVASNYKQRGTEMLQARTTVCVLCHYLRRCP